jgi:hypothetical protein
VILMPIRFTVEGQKIELIGNPFVVADSFDYLTAEFRFYDGYDWEEVGIVKKAMFQLGTGVPYEVTLTSDKTVKTDHLNLTDGVWKVSVVGYEVSGETLVERITTNKVDLLVVESGSTDGEPFPESIGLLLGFLKRDQTTQQTTTGTFTFPEVTTDSMTADKVQIDTTATPAASAAGLIQWNAVDGTYDMGLLNSSVLQVGQELMFYGKASGAIANGDACQFAGAQDDHILVKKAVAAEVMANPRLFIGVATENIANGAFGYVTWLGKINGIYTATPANQDNASWVAGDVLYVSPTTGQLTKTVPASGSAVISVGAVIKAQTGASENGIIMVRPAFGYSANEIKLTPVGTMTATDVQAAIAELYAMLNP